MEARAFGVKNLRSLTDTGLLRLKPITLLVGKNSSGKSSYLRAFPLFRQSLETPRSSPILWYHPEYVDFGTIQEAVNRDARPRQVTFEIELEFPTEANLTLPETPVQVALTLLDDRGKARVCRMQVSAGELCATVVVNASSKVTAFSVGRTSGSRIVAVLPDDASVWLSGPVSWLPGLTNGESPSVAYVRHVLRDAEGSARWRYDESSDSLWWNPLKDALRPLFRVNAREEDLDYVTGEMRLGTLEGMLNHLRTLHSSSTFSERVSGWTALGDSFFDVAASSFAWLTPYVLQAADLAVGDFMSGVSYLAPVRSAGLRSHRLMDLAVEEIDPRGENLAMFLRSLSSVEKASLQEFTKQHLGFSPDLRIQGTQAEILVSDPDVPAGVNLVDVGFGYSQVLPLTAMVWSACVRPVTRKRRRPTLLALEQPELHMHPAFQAQLAGMLADASRKSRNGDDYVPMMIETHSQALVNGLGALIEDGKLPPEDVQVVLFEQDPKTRQTSVRVVEYDGQGNLIDWPYGFFAAVSED